MIVLLSLLLWIHIIPQALCQVGVCSSIESTVQMHQAQITVSSLVSSSCGLFGWSRCYRMVYSLRTIDITYLNYHTASVCCEGYTGDGTNCLPLCQGCIEPSVCVAPSVCACVISSQDGTSNCQVPPQSLTITATGPYTLVIQWVPANTLTTSYSLYRPYGGSSEVMTVNASNHLLVEKNSLTPFTNYTFCVVGYVANLPSIPVCATGTTLESVPGGPPQNVLVTIMSSSSLDLQWEAPVIPNGVITKYMIYIDGSAHKTVDGGTWRTIVKDLIPNRNVSVSISASTKIGEGPRSMPQHFTTPESVPGEVEDFNVTVLSEISIRVTWKPPLSPNGVITGYQVALGNLATGKHTVHHVPSNQQQLEYSSGIYPYTPYDISVGATTRVGVGELQRTYVFTRQGVPVSPPQNITTNRTSATTASIKWDQIPLKSLKGFLQSYIFQHEILRAHECPTNRQYSTTTLTEVENYTIVNLDPGLQYCVRVAAKTVTGIGPFQYSQLPWFTNVEFMLVFEVENCTQWISQRNLKSQMDDLAVEISDGIKKVCHCEFTKKYIADRNLTCNSTHPNRVTFRGRIISTNMTSASNLKLDLEKWASSRPLIIDREQPKVLGPDREQHEVSGPSSSSKEEKEGDLAFLIGGCVGGIIIISILIVTVCSCLFCYRNQKKRCKSDENQPQKQMALKENVAYNSSKESKEEKIDDHYIPDPLFLGNASNNPYCAVAGPQDYEESHVYSTVS